MFKTLKNVLSENSHNNEDNLQIIFITQRKEYLCQVFSTYSIKNKDYHINTDFSTNEEYTEFLKTIKNKSNYDYNIEVSPTDRIITLSTNVSNSNKIIVLHAKLLTNSD